MESVRRVLAAGTVVAALAAGTTACGAVAAQPHGSPSPKPTPRVVRVGTMSAPTIQVSRAKTLLQLVSNPLLVQRAYHGRVASVRSWVNVDDLADSEVHLTLPDGSDVSYQMAGGTVPTRDVKAFMQPSIGKAPSSEEERDAPVQMVLEDGAVPSVGEDVVVFLSYIPQRHLWKGGLTIVVTQTPSGPTYAFTSEPEMPWKAPTSEAELNQLIAAVHAS